ncbi:MAG TPA: hypothetical protein PKI19_12545 [Elusimicrobiales bacterium]|nr:hypothetical protein [Elusimicrobiales bacterium]
MTAAKNHDWLGQAWNDYLDGFTSLLPLLLVLTALNAPAFYLVHHWHSYLPALPYVILILAPLATGSNMVYLKLVRGEKPVLTTLFSAFPVYHRAVAVTLWLGFITACGTMLFILPGLIIYSTYCLSEYLVVDRRCGIKEAFTLSAAITNGWRGLLGFLIVLTVMVDILAPNPVYITGKLSAPVVTKDLSPWVITAFCLKVFVFLPWLRLAMARLYDQLSHRLRDQAPAAGL